MCGLAHWCWATTPMCKTTTPQGEIWLLHRGSGCNVACKLSGLLMSLWLVLYQTSSTILSWLGDGGIYPHIVGNFRGRNLSRFLQFCGYLQKFSPWNLELWCPLAWQNWAICEGFLLKNHQFSPSKVSRYTVYTYTMWDTTCSFNMLLPTIWIRPVKLTVYCMR